LVFVLALLLANHAETSAFAQQPSTSEPTRIGRSLGQVRSEQSKEPQTVRTVPQPIEPETLENSSKNKTTRSWGESDGWLKNIEAWVGPKGVSQSIQTLLFLTLLSAAPAALLMTTCYVRVVIVLGILKQALGNSQLPPTQVMGGLSLFITL
jgi:flagellar biosynthetic protein FliP